MKDRSGKEKKRSIGNSRRLQAILLAFAMTVGTFAGCGQQDSPQKGADAPVSGQTGADTKAGNSGQDAQNGENAESEKAAMGRYVETAVELPEGSGRSYGITLLTDGRLLILDEGLGQIISKDNGQTWEAEAIPGIPDMSAFTKENYIFSMAAAPDGQVAVLATKRMKEDDDGISPPSLWVAAADGSTQFMEELPVSEDELYLYNIFYSPEGELFGTPLGSGVVYQIDPAQETLTKYVSLEWRPDLIKFRGDQMFCLTSREGVSIYDRKAEKWQEDSVLADFMEENFMTEYYANEAFTVYVEPGEEGVLYIAGKTGMYRHVIGGSAIEQIIDGGLSSFSNPSMDIIGVAAFGENEFAVLFSTHRVVLYRYDPAVTTVPEELVNVYSLEEEETVRQAIAQFQAENPDIFVRYEVGRSGTDGVSAEDAIKKLNTELMAGSGPDVIILDGLPQSSYVEKGILMDLKPHIDSLRGEAVLLPNMVDAFSQDGKVFMMPVSFTLPVVAGRREDIAGITDYASLADTAEKLREEHPDAMIGQYFSEEAMMRWFLPVTATAFVEDAGGVDEAALREYLTLTDRIYQAATEGQSDTQREMCSNLRDAYRAEQWFYRNFNSIAQQSTDFFWEDMVLATGMLNNLYGYQEMLSLKYDDDFADVELQSFDGMSEGVFVPSILVGINAATTHQADAERFFDTIMGIEVQSLLYDGFMVNQEALKQQLSPQWGVFRNADMDVDYGEVSSSVGGSDGEGREYHMNIYMPTREEFANLYDLCCKVHTPYIADRVVEEALLEIGTQYLEGYLSLDETVRKILAKVELYMAE